MKDERLYSIGEVSRICNVSRKALRFYDKIGMISPDHIDEGNRYRYYSRDTLLSVPIIKYYKQMGFRLEEMKRFLASDNYEVHKRGFREKIEELGRMRSDVNVSYTSVRDWYDLILEAEEVLENRATEVSVKYVEPMNVCCMEQDFDGSYMESIINIEWTNYLERIGHAITGPVHLIFHDLEGKMREGRSKVTVCQRPAGDADSGVTMKVGGRMMLSSYHIGPHETMNSTYEKISSWAEGHGYRCGNRSIERYVTDYWTIRDPHEFVTEVLVAMDRG